MKNTDTTRDTLLKLFDYKCPICCGNITANDIHHIDGNRDNNDELNLIPICPTCHQNYHRNHSYDSGIIFLLRKHKNKIVLSPQFKILYDKFSFIYSIVDDYDISVNAVKNLRDFLKNIGQNEYYSDKINKLIPCQKGGVFHMGPSGVCKSEIDAHKNGIIQDINYNIKKNKEEIEKLMLEFATLCFTEKVRDCL
ncbi:MAG: HNH endonuclease signature motif containing protein [Candidatus Nanoarchaeia archaeon]|jgi:hypothetical protein|nr:HNH endonuclease signature motif containing protein [Candidatus Nanoarchaeia archaeon]